MPPSVYPSFVVQLQPNLVVSMTSSSCFGIFPGQNSSFLIFCPIELELKFGTEVNPEALISNSSLKIRYKYILKEKHAIFYEKLKFLPKRSLTKVLLWQHPGLLLTENYFK